MTDQQPAQDAGQGTWRYVATSRGMRWTDGQQELRSVDFESVVAALTATVKSLEEALREIEFNTGPRILDLDKIELRGLLIDVNQRAALARTAITESGGEA